MSEKLHRLPAVIDIVGLGRSSIYMAIKAGTFPAPVRIGAKAVAWKDSDIKKWIESRELAIEARAVRGLAGKILRGEVPTDFGG